MQRKHARLIFLMSLLLLSLVVLDFTQISNKKEPVKAPPKANLTDAANKIADSIYSGQNVLGDAVATGSALPEITIVRPAQNFETDNKMQSVAGQVSDYHAKITAKLNDRFIGEFKVATATGEFSSQVELENGKNTIALTAVARTGASTVASVSGTLLVGDQTNGNLLMYTLLFVLATLAGYGIVRSLRKLSSPKTPTINP